MTAWPANGFADWIGRFDEDRECLSPQLAQRFVVTLPSAVQTEGALPLGLQWCLAPIAEDYANLGGDGHPKLGLHLPPVPLPRRMWAGGALEFFRPFAIGDHVTRRSTIKDVKRKTGSTGELAFVTVEHDYSTDAGLALRERQDIVYRNPADIGKARAAAPVSAPQDPGVAIETNPVMLFRYSALTFNGHRIHYDAPYARDVEGYDGLVTHGPLIATLLMNYAQMKLGAPLKQFAFRGQSPAIVGQTLHLHADQGADGLTLTATGPAGKIIMTAEAR